MFQAKVLEKTFAEDEDSLCLDLTQAYDVPSLHSLTRRMTLDRRSGEITITDQFSVSREEAFESALITCLPVEVLDSHRLLLHGRQGSMQVSVEAQDAVLAFDCVKHAVTGDHDVPAHPLRIAVKGKWQTGSVTLRLQWISGADACGQMAAAHTASTRDNMQPVQHIGEESSNAQ